MPALALAFALSLLCLPLSAPMMALLIGESSHSTLLALAIGWPLGMLPLHFVPWLRQRRFGGLALLILLIPCAATLAASLAPIYWLRPEEPSGYSPIEYIMNNSRTEQWRHLLALSLIPLNLLIALSLALNIAFSKPVSPAIEGATGGNRRK